MKLSTFVYHWEWVAKANPEKLWSLLADTDRFNRDAGLPNVTFLGFAKNGNKRARFRKFGITVEWEEEPFDWTWPVMHSVVRNYVKGPVQQLVTAMNLVRTDKGTKVVFDVRAKPGNIFGIAAIVVQIGLISRIRFGETVKRYDQIATSLQEKNIQPKKRSVQFTYTPLIRQIKDSLMEKGFGIKPVTNLCREVIAGDELSLSLMRPYAYADNWGEVRNTILKLFLEATRLGLLEFSWNLLCPACRGVQTETGLLRNFETMVHCASCHIDVAAQLEKNVEITFHPSPTIRKITKREYCIGGPMLTSHVFYKQKLEPGQNVTLKFQVPLPTGNYRFLCSSDEGMLNLQVASTGKKIYELLCSDIASASEFSLHPNGQVHINNNTNGRSVIMLERTAWSDQAVTGGEIIALQTFRDLFASEAIRPGQQISVGSITVVFTDLKGSTKLYRAIGDASAFGHVLNHFDVLKNAIATNNGAIVKTIGDAVMAVFIQPLNAVKAMLFAQRELFRVYKDPELRLKAGIHYGPCIAVNLNDRLDYFGTTVNLAARLEAQTNGTDIVITKEVANEPQVAKFLLQNSKKLITEEVSFIPKGFDKEIKLIKIHNAF